jgi:uncharacterized protein (DUF58 family)
MNHLLQRLGAIQPTPRAFLLIAIAVLLFGLSSLWQPFVFVALVWLMFVVALLLVDWRISAQPADWSIRREHDNRLSLGADNTIRMHVRRHVASPRRFIGEFKAAPIWVRDTPPALFRVDATERILSAEIAPGAEKTLTYSVRPPQRGDYRFGDLYLRWQSRLGLLRRQMTIPAAGPVRVYPNLVNVRRYELLARRNQTWELGLRNSRRFGSGSEFERLRDYQADDEYRRINWKATARRNVPIVMEYETERSQNIVAMLDIGRMMRSPVGDIAKLDYAINAVLFLAYVAAQKGDRVGVLTFAHSPQTWIAPGSGKAHFHRLLEQLYAVESLPTEPDYSAAFTYFATKQNKRSLVLVFSDLTGDLGAQSLFAHMAQIQKRHLALLVTLRDPTIQSWTRQHPTDTQNLYRRTIAEQLLEERRLLLERLQRLGVRSLDAPASELNAQVINRYLELKARAAL